MRSRLQPIATIASRASRTTATIHLMMRTNPDYADFSKEMNALVPDTATMVKQMQAELGIKRNKVFGRDIFNNKDLSFEPNMNIATPQNYRLGPGDAVIIDIYGASQKTIESTVSPDGEVTIEGYGPVSVSGLTVAQANARLRNTVGSRYRSSRIKLTVGQTKTIMVNVMGEVKIPGHLYPLSLRHRIPCPLHGRRNQRSGYIAKHQGIQTQQAGNSCRHLRLHSERQADG